MAAFAVLLSPGPAAAETSHVDIPRWKGYGQLIGPILTADGGTVFGVQRSAGAIDILRASPGATQAEKVTSIPVPGATAHGAAWSSVGVTLIAAGQGFFLYQEKQGGVIHCCDWHAFDPKLTWFATPGAAGADVTICDGGACSDCGYLGGPAVALAGDAAAALILPRCRFTDGTARGPFVRDLATGAAHPLDYPPYTGGDRLAGRFVSYWGPHGIGVNSDYSHFYSGSVIDWQTGETVRTIQHMGQHVLLDDGTVIYNSNYDPRDPQDATVRRWDVSADAPVELPKVRGVVQTAADGRLLTIEDLNGPHVLDVWTLTGEPVASLPLPAEFTAVGFDGQRAAYFDPACATARLQIWDIGSAAPSRLSPVCGPVTLGAVELARGRARVEVSCPARVVQGCVGGVQLTTPRPAHVRHGPFWLQAGQRNWVPLATQLSRQRCRALARTRTWRLRVSFSSVYGQQSRTVRRRPAVAC